MIRQVYQAIQDRYVLQFWNKLAQNTYGLQKRILFKCKLYVFLYYTTNACCFVKATYRILNIR